MEYIDREEPLILMEYGRNVQNLVNYICTIPDRDRRTAHAHTLINLMKQLNPSVKENAGDSNQRIWDHLHVMSKFRLDVDSPYPKPDPETLYAKPQRMGYVKNDLKFLHYGRNVELLIQRALVLEDPAEIEQAAMFIAKLMKEFYSAWNKESMDDDLIIMQMYEMSGHKLDLRDKLREAKGNLLTSKQEKSSRPERQPHQQQVRGEREHGKSHSKSQQGGSNAKRRSKRRRN